MSLREVHGTRTHADGAGLGSPRARIEAHVRSIRCLWGCGLANPLVSHPLSLVGQGVGPVFPAFWFAGTRTHADCWTPLSRLAPVAFERAATLKPLTGRGSCTVPVRPLTRARLHRSHPESRIGHQNVEFYTRDAIEAMEMGFLLLISGSGDPDFDRPGGAPLAPVGLGCEERTSWSARDPLEH